MSAPLDAVDIQRLRFKCQLFCPGQGISLVLEERAGLAEGIKYFGIVLQSTNKNKKSKVDPGTL